MNELITILIGSGKIGGIFAFLGKKIIDKGFDAALQGYENKLELLKIEHQIKYSALHEERALILKTLYKDLYKLEIELEHFTSIFQGPDWINDSIREINANTQLNKCIDTLEENRIFFSIDFCNELKQALNECFIVV